MTITERRRNLDMSLGECARKVGIDTVALSRIERGVKTAPDSVLETIATLLDCSLEELKAGIPSPEEADNDFTRFSDGLLAMTAAMDDANKRGLGKGHGGTGQIECPVCKGKLHYSVASVNGHIWGKCENPDCVRWMQ